MSKFTFFTILFSLTVIVIVGNIVLRDAIFPREYKTATIGEENVIRNYDEEDSEMPNPPLAPEKAPPKNPNEEFESEEEIPPDLEPGTKPSIFETPSPTPPQPEPITQSVGFLQGFLLKAGLIQQVGFLDVTPKLFSGKIFDLFDIRNQRVSSVAVFETREEGSGVAMLTEIRMPDEISAHELYALIQNKTKVYVDLSVNETNTYGDRSFYINHIRKQEEAFLVFRMRNYLFTFAYLKDYHPRIKALIGFLTAAILDQPAS